MSGYLVKENKDYGTELAFGNSVVLATSALYKMIKVKAFRAVPLGLAAAGGLGAFYYQRKIREFRYGV